METEVKKPTSAIAGPSALARPPDHPNSHSRADVAPLVGDFLPTVTRWARTGLIPTIRMPGGHHRFHGEGVRRAAGSKAAAITRVD